MAALGEFPVKWPGDGLAVVVGVCGWSATPVDLTGGDGGLSFGRGCRPLMIFGNLVLALVASHDCHSGDAPGWTFERIDSEGCNSVAVAAGGGEFGSLPGWKLRIMPKLPVERS
jgi:hypothetical protein